jgi:hypothetical protein
MRCLSGSVLVLALGAAAAVGCASKQRITLECVPHEVTVYVDGREVDAGTESLELREDRPHTLFFKGGGYEPRMLVLESREVDGERALSPHDVCSESVFVPMRPEVQMEPVSEGPPEG